MTKVRVNTNCKSCEATGLYQGMAELQGCAVVCHVCNGTGCNVIEYEPFGGRRIHKNIQRVFAGSFGYKHAPGDKTTTSGKTIFFSKGGCTYDEWLHGAEPKPVKDLYCPYLWESQSMQGSEHPKHKMYKDKCEKAISLGHRITECPHYEDKKKCWELYDSMDK